jgi:hypothetical protein
LSIKSKNFLPMFINCLIKWNFLFNFCICLILYKSSDEKKFFFFIDFFIYQNFIKILRFFVFSAEILFPQKSIEKNPRNFLFWIFFEIIFLKNKEISYLEDNVKFIKINSCWWEKLKKEIKLKNYLILIANRVRK